MQHPEEPEEEGGEDEEQPGDCQDPVLPVDEVVDDILGPRRGDRRVRCREVRGNKQDHEQYAADPA